MSPKAIPAGDRVLIKDIEPEAGIVRRAQRAGLAVVILPENEPQPTSGTVVAVGNGALVQEFVSEGDTVLFGRHAGLGVQLEGEEYRMLEWREISMVIKPDEPTSLEPPGSPPLPGQEKQAMEGASEAEATRLTEPSQDPESSGSPQPRS